jgi:hypothetical protein
MSLRSDCFIKEALFFFFFFFFSGKKQNFQPWDYYPQVLDYQDF